MTKMKREGFIMCKTKLRLILIFYTFVMQVRIDRVQVAILMYMTSCFCLESGVFG